MVSLTTSHFFKKNIIVCIFNQQFFRYDRHKDTFHADSADVVDHSIDEVYLTSDCYTGYDDSPTGFYTVYRDLFDEILEVETPHRGDGDKKNDSDSSDEYPRFGNSKTDVSEVKAFYDRWQAFSTAISFAHLDKYDIRDAPNRRVVRLMEKENKKIRDEAKKNRNSLIQVTKIYMFAFYYGFNIIFIFN